MACHCVSWPLLSSLSESLIKKISHVFVFDGGNNCFFVTQDDDIYALGRNGKHAPLGCGSCEFIRQPKRIAELRNEPIINIVAVNDGHVVALCKSGKVFSWARQNMEGFETVPFRMDYEGFKFVKIALGESHALALAETGQAVSWGKNTFGQLGNKCTHDSMKPLEVEIHRVSIKDGGKMKLKFIDITCTAAASFFLTSQGRVYSCGYFEAGHGLKHGNTVITPIKVYYQGMPQLRKIVAGRNAVFALDHEYNLYSWGSSDKGQCGLGKMDFVKVPQKLEMGSKSFHDIGAHCDSDFAAAITNFGCVYVWGQTRFGIFKTPIQTELSTVDDAFIVYDQSRSFRLMETWITEVDIPNMPQTVKNNVTIVINQERFQLYLIILYRRSKYFRKLIDSGKINDQNWEIQITGYSVQAFKLYIEWIETGRMTAANLTSDILFELYMLARNLPEPDFLRLLIMKYKLTEEREINYKNVCKVYEEALEEGNEKLMHRCLEFISKNPLCYIFCNAFLHELKLKTTRQLLLDLAEHHIDRKALMAILERADEATSRSSSHSLELELISWDETEDYDNDMDSYALSLTSSGSVTVQSETVIIEKKVVETMEFHDGEEDSIQAEPPESSSTKLIVTTK